MTPMERTEHHFGPFLGEGFWGNIRQPLLLPAPFVLLLNVEDNVYSILYVRNFPEPPTPGSFSKVTPVQLGGVLRYNWEAYCGTNGRCTVAFPFLQGLEASKAQCYKWGGTAVQNGGVLPVLFRQVVRVGGS